MAARNVARVDLDRVDRPIASGATTVYTNDKMTAFKGSITQSGRAIIQGAATVFVEDKPIAREGDNATRGSVRSGSQDVFAGD